MSDRLRCSAPARANLIGNPSDQYGGVTLGCSLAYRAQVELAPASETTLACGDERQRVATRQDLGPRGDSLDLGRAVISHLGLEALAERPVAIRYGSEIPRQSGLAGSTALVVALLHALLVWRGKHLEPAPLAERARRLERDDLGVACGYVDQYLCVFGGTAVVDFAGKTPEGSVPPEPFARVESVDAPLPFVLANTGVRHSSDAVHRPLQARWRAGEAAVVDGYRRVAELGRLGLDALRSRDWPALGAAMDENHAIQRDLGGSGEANERLIRAAREAGALGAKLAGAGQGGTVVALWPEPERGPLRAAFERAGAAAILSVEPGPGVRIEAG